MTESASARMRALNNARRHLGVTEHPPRSNSGPEVTGWLRRCGVTMPAPWCMAFLWCMFADAGLELNYPNRASVGFFEEWARQHGLLVAAPEAGDVVCYRFDADDWPDHVGIVEQVAYDHIIAIEGNTAYGNDANGGTVMRRTRGLRRCSFARINDPAFGADLTMVYAGIPQEMFRWFKWKDRGSRPEERPYARVRAKVPKRWWVRYQLHRGKVL